MNKVFIFILVGLLFAAFPGEISNQLLIHRTVHGFVVTLLNYVWFLALGFAVKQFFDRRFANRYVSTLRFYLLYGFIGICIEWFLLLPGFAFQPHPVQLMLFSFWAGMMLTPCLFIEEPVTNALQTIRTGLLYYMLAWSGIALLPFVVASLLHSHSVEQTRHFSMLAYGIGVLGTNLYFFRYFKLLKAQVGLVSPISISPSHPVS